MSRLKVIQQRGEDSPFDVRDSRAMVSIGPPANLKRHCNYACPFCYVDVGFRRYANMPIPDIVRWLSERRDSFDIIYVSGDTDSFAPPRMEQGISLLESLQQFDADILFTTRAVLEEACLQRLSKVATDLKSRSRILIGCVSIAQLKQPKLEPPPIPSVFLRIEQLKKFKQIGVATVLALRPFLPNVPPTDLLQVLEKCVPSVDVVLGEVWYTDPEGMLVRRVMQNSSGNVPLVAKEMDFDANLAEWRVFEGKDHEKLLSQRCKELGVPFFMRSKPAIELIRQQYSFSQKPSVS